MRSRARLRVAKVVVVCLLVPLLPGVSAGTASSPSPPPARDVLALPAARALAGVAAKPLDMRRLWRPAASGIRVAVVSSGVDLDVFPDALRARVWNASADHVGYGTYATSVLLQLAPDTRITSLDVYPAERFDAGAQGRALAWAAAHAKEIDAVLYAVPPHEFLDPVSSAMASGSWDAIADALSANPLQTPNGPLFGVAMNRAVRARQAAGADRRALDAFAGLTGAWKQAAEQVRALNASGVAVVAPAGDLGPDVQTILGFANLPEVITVGGANDRAVSESSSSGPSIDGRVKPDLVAPTGIVGLLPERSVLARTLGPLVDAGLEPLWDAGRPLTRARARLDSSLTSATVVAAATAGLAAQGVRDVARQRGALTAASVPLPGISPWRQGAGLLRGMPDARFASSRPLALGHADLGVEPDAGSWSTTAERGARSKREWSTRVAFSGGAPARARTRLFAFAGVGPDARTYTREVKASDAPPVGVAAGAEGVDLTVPLGDGRFEGGVFCGYTEVSVPATSGTVDPAVRIDGVPDGLEQVPTCLVKGSGLQAHGFYIHDLPAESLTFALLPALPEEASLLAKPLMILPVNPLHTKLYARVTGQDGNAWFPNVVPGYYTIRLFSDYGSPVSQTLLSTALGSDVLRLGDIGENPSYLSFPALVLSATGWTERDLRERFGDRNVRKEGPTGAYLVTVGPRTVRVVLGFVKDKPGTSVASRYIDLLGYEDLDFAALPLTDVLRIPAAARAVGADVRAWTFRPGATSPDDVVAQLNPVAAAGQAKDLLGVGSYPFALTTPNYKAHLSLNFSYEVSNALILVLVRVGDEVAAGVVTPWGTVRTPTVGPFTPLGTGGVGLSNQASGLANFELDLLPRGADRGTLTFVFVPSRPVEQLAAPLASARIGDLSFALDTWQRIQWPGQMTPHGMGHLFSFDPNYSADQMSAPGCRRIAGGDTAADVCEDWRVMVHSPGDDAATVELVDARGSVNPSLRASGAEYADPRRGVARFGALLAFEVPKAGGLDALAASLPMDLATNGRFWEQLVLTRDVLREHPDDIQVQIVDNLPGRANALVPHVLGHAPVSPYVAFSDQAVAFDGEQIALTDRDGDGVPQLAIAVRTPGAVDAVDEIVRLGDPDDDDASVPGRDGAITFAAEPVAVAVVGIPGGTLPPVPGPADAGRAPAAVASDPARSPQVTPSAAPAVRVPALRTPFGVTTARRKR